jgi:hypothetical protein
MNAKDLATYCASQGIGMVGTNLFYSFLPDAPDDCITIFDTGGWEKDPDFPRTDPTFQFMFRGANYDSAQALIEDVKALFMSENIPKKCFSIGSDYIHLVQPMQATAFYLGRDENGRDKFTWNFTFIIH